MHLSGVRPIYVVLPLHEESSLLDVCEMTYKNSRCVTIFPSSANSVWGHVTRFDIASCNTEVEQWGLTGGRECQLITKRRIKSNFIRHQGQYCKQREGVNIMLHAYTRLAHTINMHENYQLHINILTLTSIYDQQKDYKWHLPWKRFREIYNFVLTLFEKCT